MHMSKQSRPFTNQSMNSIHRATYIGQPKMSKKSSHNPSTQFIDALSLARRKDEYQEIDSQGKMQQVPREEPEKKRWYNADCRSNNVARMPKGPHDDLQSSCLQQEGISSCLSRDTAETHVEECRAHNTHQCDIALEEFDATGKVAGPEKKET